MWINHPCPNTADGLHDLTGIMFKMRAVVRFEAHANHTEQYYSWYSPIAHAVPTDWSAEVELHALPMDNNNLAYPPPEVALTLVCNACGVQTTFSGLRLLDMKLTALGATETYTAPGLVE
jgi:hypothetical protein